MRDGTRSSCTLLTLPAIRRLTSMVSRMKGLRCNDASERVLPDAASTTQSRWKHNIQKAALGFIVLGLLSVSLRVDGSAAGPDRSLESYQQLADSLFRSCNWKQTRATLMEARRVYPRSAEVLWRLSNSYINEGDALEGDKAEAAFHRSIEYAEEAVRSDPRNANAHALHAAALGSLAMFAGGKQKVKMTYQIRDALDRALAIDQANVIAHTIYGTWHREVADVGWVERKLADVFLGGLPKGSFELSVRHLKSAIRSDPGMLRHHYELGLTYEAMDQPLRAAAAYRAALLCSDSWSIDWKRRQRMKDFLAEHAESGT